MTMNPLSWSYRDWRIFFIVAALWNALGAVPGLCFSALNLEIFYGVEGADDLTIFLNQCVWWAVLVYGIGYLIVASAPDRHLGIVAMGIIAKVIIAALWIRLFAIDRATFMAAFAALGDSVFTLLFVLYLIKGPRAPEVSIGPSPRHKESP